MNDTVFNTINRYSLISKGDTVLIAISGGADSVFLAKFLIEIREEYNLTLKAAHIEHGIRGKDSLSDCEFTEKFCRDNNIECHTLHIKAEKEARIAGKSVEEYSRNRRYEFFDTIECDKIATAHNLSDNIETVLMRLARGMSLKGACGIPVKRGKIIRPLLFVTGSEIRDYLNGRNIKYCVDSTNNSDKYERNYVRNNIFPLFKAMNPEFERAALRFIESSNEDCSFIEKSAESAYNLVCENGELNTLKLREYHVSIIKRVLIKFFSNYNFVFSENHIREILKLVYSSGRTQISGNLFAVSAKNRLRAVYFSDSEKNGIYKFEKSLFSAEEFLNKCELYNKKFDFYCDCDKIIGSVVIRSRREGDKITPLRRGCTKTLKKLYNELGIPIEIRNKIPVISDELGVIGVCGYCVDERVAVNSSTKNVIAVSIFTEDNI